MSSYSSAVKQAYAGLVCGYQLLLMIWPRVESYRATSWTVGQTAAALNTSTTGHTLLPATAGAVYVVFAQLLPPTGTQIAGAVGSAVTTEAGNLASNSQPAKAMLRLLLLLLLSLSS